MLAFWHQGLGRIAALTAEVDGQYSQRLNAWSGLSGVRRRSWPLAARRRAAVGRAGHDRTAGGQGIVRVELDPGRKRGGRTSSRRDRHDRAAGRSRRSRTPQRLTLAWVGEDTLEARFPIQKAGIYLGAVQLANSDVLPLAPLSLPYSPEFEPRQDPEEGRRRCGDGAGHRRHRANGMGRRVQREPAAESSGARLVIPLTLLLLAAAHRGDRRTTIAAFCGGECVAAECPVASPTLAAVVPQTARPSRCWRDGGARGEERNSGSEADGTAEVARGISPLARAKAKARGRVKTTQ